MRPIVSQLAVPPSVQLVVVETMLPTVAISDDWADFQPTQASPVVGLPGTASPFGSVCVHAKPPRSTPFSSTSMAWSSFVAKRPGPATIWIEGWNASTYGPWNGGAKRVAGELEIPSE